MRRRKRAKGESYGIRDQREKEFSLSHLVQNCLIAVIGLASFCWFSYGLIAGARPSGHDCEKACGDCKNPCAEKADGTDYTLPQIITSEVK